MERLHFDQTSQSDAWDLGIHIARYGVVSKLCAGRTVLDFACGEGYGSYLMATRWGAAAVDAVDISDEALSSAKRNFDDPRISWIKCDANSLRPETFSKKYDLIISLETIEHIDEPEGFLKILGDLLAPSGVVCVSCPNDEWYYGKGVTHNSFHKHVFSFEQFQEFSERSLGKASHFILGSPVKGIASVPLKVTSPALLPTTDTIKQVEQVTSFYFAPAPAEAATIQESLYFIGLWGPEAAFSELAPSGAWTAVTPEQTQHLQHIRPPVMPSGKKPVVILAADVPGWAYCNIAQHVKQNLSSSYDVQILYVGQYSHWSEFYYDAFWTREASFVHIFWREYLFETVPLDIASEVTSRFGVNRNTFLQRIADTVITTSIYDHLNLDSKSMAERELLFSLVDAYFVSSEKLMQIYRERLNCAPDLVIEDGVDLQLFKPKNLDRFKDHQRELVIGWAGNSAWCKSATYDPKGFHTVLLPALEILRKEGIRIRGEFADASQRKRPRTEMVDYYNSIDIYVCVSEIEGTPNPVLESMACGIPVISTDVGIVPQVFGSKQREFILKERSPRALADAIKKLYHDRTTLQRLSEENLTQIQSWSWRDKMRSWLTLFRLGGSRANSRNITRKKFLFGGGAQQGAMDLNSRGILTEQQSLMKNLILEVDRLSCVVAEKDRTLTYLAEEATKSARGKSTLTK